MYKFFAEIQWIRTNKIYFTKFITINDLIEVEDQKTDTLREVCKIVCKSLQLDEMKLCAIVADNCSAMRAALRFHFGLWL